MLSTNQVFFAATNLAQTGYEKEGAAKFLLNAYAKVADSPCSCYLGYLCQKTKR